MKTEHELINEANIRGYRKGSIIHYFPDRQSVTDIVVGNYFEVDSKGNLNAYAKPKSERKSFDDFTHDELYNANNDSWVKLIK